MVAANDVSESVPLRKLTADDHSLVFVALKLYLAILTGEGRRIYLSLVLVV